MLGCEKPPWRWDSPDVGKQKAEGFDHVKGQKSPPHVLWVEVHMESLGRGGLQSKVFVFRLRDCTCTRVSHEIVCMHAGRVCKDSPRHMRRSHGDMRASSWPLSGKLESVAERGRAVCVGHKGCDAP